MPEVCPIDRALHIILNALGCAAAILFTWIIVLELKC